MFALFVVGLIVALVAVIAVFALKRQKAAIRMLAPLALFLIAGVLMVSACVRTVPTGHTGIITVFGKVKDKTHEAGVHLCAPWESVVNMDNRNQKASVDLLCFSSDIQEVSVTYTINYQISKQNAQMIYKEIGVSYYETVITPGIQEAVKSEFAKYTAEQLLNSRAQLSADIRAKLTEDLSEYNIVVIDSSIEDIDFSDVFTAAVEAKQVAEQKSKQAQIEQQQKNMEAEAAAKRAEIEANAAAKVAEIEAKTAAEVAKIAAEADADVVRTKAEAAAFAGEQDAAIVGHMLEILAKDPENITNEDVENLLMYYYVLQWNGVLPETYLGSEEFYSLLLTLGKTLPQQTPEVSAPEVGA
ncbi:MAG: prohibitin family protein [Ruminococcaceae bacterium]|nr:prohibitin family protein [Oscillospiraceae bacterium]